jgi:hypothetical protein
VHMNDDSAPDQSLPLFLSNDADGAEQRGSSRILWAGFLTLAALAVGGATLLLGDPGSRITALTASLTGASAPATDHAEATPPAQSTVEAQATAPAETEAPRDQQPAAAAPEPAEPKQADAAVDRDALFRQFQAWAQQQNGKPDRQQDSRQETQVPATRDVSIQPAPPQPAAETTQAVPTRVEPKAPAPVAQAPVRAVQKQRPVRELRNARAEIESERRAKAKAAAQTYWTPTEEPRAPDTPAQSPETPWLLRLFGGHNQ